MSTEFVVVKLNGIESVSNAIATVTNEAQAVSVLGIINAGASELVRRIVPLYTALVLRLAALRSVSVDTITREQCKEWLVELDKQGATLNGDKWESFEYHHLSRVRKAVATVQQERAALAAYRAALPPKLAAHVAQLESVGACYMSVNGLDAKAATDAMSAAKAVTLDTMPAAPIKSKRTASGEVAQVSGDKAEPTSKTELEKAAQVVANDGKLTREAMANARKLTNAVQDDGAFIAALAFIFQDGPVTRAALQAWKAASK